MRSARVSHRGIYYTRTYLHQCTNAVATARAANLVIPCSKYTLLSFSRSPHSPKMSHTVTITRTTAVSSGGSTGMYINCGYLSTMPGLLKFAQLLLGTACVGVVAVYMDDYKYQTAMARAGLFFLLIAVAFLIGTFCLLTACLVTLSTATIISKTIYEVIYHGLAFVLYLAAGLTLIIEVNHHNRNYEWYNGMLAASIMGLVMAGLYLLSTFLANRSYRGI